MQQHDAAIEAAEDDVAAILGHRGKGAADMLGGVDALKLRSSLTLFALADPSNMDFSAALDEFYDGARDERTGEMLGLPAA